MVNKNQKNNSNQEIIFDNISNLINKTLTDIELKNNNKLTNNEINKIIIKSPDVILPSEPQIQSDIIVKRDIAVINNPLYPPLSRTERPIFDDLVNNPNLNVSTRGSPDTFRALAYIINKNEQKKDLGNNVWRLFGRQSYRGSNKGEFYLTPVNDINSTMKVYLQDNMMIGEKIRDIYSLPQKIRFKSTFFNDDEYEINELPKANLNSDYL